MSDDKKALKWTQIRDLTFLEPELREVAQLLLDKARGRGLDIRITETYRSPEHQKMAKESGASQTMFGWHTAGRAIDFGVFDKDGSYLGKAEDYEVMGDLVGEVIQENPKYQELIWGGDWTSPVDMPHVEFHPGYAADESKKWHEENPDYVSPGMLGSEER